MDAAAELGRNPVSKHQTQPEYGDEQADATTEPITRDQILRLELEQGNIIFPCSADHKQDWQPCPLNPALPIYNQYLELESDRRRVFVYLILFWFGIQ